jgi:hypothetical protein
VFFGYLPDEIGGARVALVCVVVEAVGQAMIWLARSPVLVFAGAAITGAALIAAQLLRAPRRNAERAHAR